MKFKELEFFTAITNIIKKYHNGRDIILIGYYPRFADFLTENGLTIRKTYRLSEGKKNVSPLRFIKNDKLKAEDCYILFTETPRKTSYCLRMAEWGFDQFKDYVFANHGKITLPAHSPDYEDEYGNKVHGGGCKVFLNDTACNVTIEVDDTTTFDDKCFISVRHAIGASIQIGGGCKFVDNASVVAVGDASISIGRKNTIVSNASVVAFAGNTITIGDDCLISYDVRIYSGDGHAFYDSVTQERLNPPIHQPKNIISIGNHVWIGMRVVIINRCQIGDGCIIGGCALVKGTYPNNCTIGGNPAKLLRKNVSWAHNHTESTFEDCPPAYTHATEES